MNYFPELVTIKARCESIISELDGINPDNELMLYDGTDLPPFEQERLTDRLMAVFGPDDYNSVCPTDEELCIAFQSLQNALEAAVVVEKAKSGFYGQH